MPYATVSDVEIDYGPVGSELTEKVETLLDRVEESVRRVMRYHGRNLDALVASGRLPVVTIKQVCSEMVAAAMRNPDGAVAISRSDTTGPFSSQESRSFRQAGGDGELSARHRAMLSLPDGNGPVLVSFAGSW